MIEAPDSTLELAFQCAAFSVEAVKRAAYAMMAVYDVEIAVEADMICCRLSPARPGGDMGAAEQAFRREVLDQDLRLSIETKTAGYRDAILGLAFSKTGLQNV